MSFKQSARSGTAAEHERPSSSRPATAARSSWPGSSAAARFPAISTGAFGYPVELAAPVAIAATEEALTTHPEVELARFVFRDEATLASYRAALTK
jgi:O-acetyl-ADP-ribose deacetylase (regulator of RNase III)